MITIEVPNNPIMLRHVGQALVEMSEQAGMLQRVPDAKPVDDATPEPCVTKSEFVAEVETVPAPPAETGIVGPPVGDSPIVPAPPVNVPAPPVDTVVETAAAPVVTGPLDSAGYPWDARIHASTKTTTADGKWKYKRGVDATIKAAIEAELKGDMPAYDAIPAQGVEGVETMPAETAGAPLDFASFMAWLTQQKPAFEPAQLDTACAAVGVAGGIMALAAADAALLPKVQELLAATR